MSRGMYKALNLGQKS